jgi:hypothetical protein
MVATTVIEVGVNVPMPRDDYWKSRERLLVVRHHKLSADSKTEWNYGSNEWWFWNCQVDLKLRGPVILWEPNKVVCLIFKSLIWFGDRDTLH